MEIVLGGLSDNWGTMSPWERAQSLDGMVQNGWTPSHTDIEAAQAPSFTRAGTGASPTPGNDALVTIAGYSTGLDTLRAAIEANPAAFGTSPATGGLIAGLGTHAAALPDVPCLTAKALQAAGVLPAVFDCSQWWWKAAIWGAVALVAFQVGSVILSHARK